jgi:hypothetical protein
MVPFLDMAAQTPDEVGRVGGVLKRLVERFRGTPPAGFHVRVGEPRFADGGAGRGRRGRGTDAAARGGAIGRSSPGLRGQRGGREVDRDVIRGARGGGARGAKEQGVDEEEAQESRRGAGTAQTPPWTQWRAGHPAFWLDRFSFGIGNARDEGNTRIYIQYW